MMLGSAQKEAPFHFSTAEQGNISTSTHHSENPARSQAEQHDAQQENAINNEKHDQLLYGEPHALGQEKSVLSTFLNEPDKLTENHGITEDSFYKPAHQIVFRTVTKLASDGKTPELVSLCQAFSDDGTMEAVGGAADITAIYNYAPNAAHFAQHVRELHDKHAQRLFARAGRAAQEGDESGFHQLIAERDRIRELASNQDSLLERLESLRYDPDKPPPPDEVCLTLLDQPVAARGNISVIQAKIKSGKTGVVSSGIATAIRGSRQAQGDTLGFAWRGDATGAILHFDTEQSPADHHACVERARKRAGIANTERLHSYPLMTFEVRERMDVLRRKMKQLASVGKVDCVIVDGIADLSPDVMKPEEAIDLVAKLMRLSHEYDCAIIVVIHENPGTDSGKTRGHLGSELQRKAFANIRIDKDPETNVSTIYGTEMRKGAIPKQQGLCFAWDDKQGMHVTLGIYSQIVGQAKEYAKAEKEWKRWKGIFDLAPDENGTKCVCPELSPEQAAKIIRDINGTEKPPKAETIKKQMQRAEIIGVLRKSGRGTWQMNRTGQFGT